MKAGVQARQACQGHLRLHRHSAWYEFFEVYLQGLIERVWDWGFWDITEGFRFRKISRLRMRCGLGVWVLLHPTLHPETLHRAQ